MKLRVSERALRADIAGSLHDGERIALDAPFRRPGPILRRGQQIFARGSKHGHGAVDFAMFARSLGAHGERVADNRDFAPALERALALRRPALIEVLSDPELISVGATIAQLRAR